MKVLGYVMANNEWPLLGLSITHALEYAVDHVVVVIHNQSNSVRAHLKRLKISLKGLITIYELEGPYFQESTTHISLALTDLKEFDWVYIFDCDEFTIVKSKKLFHKNLESLSKNIHAVRYNIEQFISPYDFNENNIKDFLKIKFKSVPNIFYKFDDRILYDELLHENINFFDIPFPSKIIFRKNFFENIGPGAHNLDINKLNECFLKSSIFYVVHLPMISFDKLKSRSEHGKLLIDQKYPPWYGWQNQLIYLIDINNGLTNFWKKHSVPENLQNESVEFTYKIDNIFKIKIQKTIKKYKKLMTGKIIKNIMPTILLSDLVRINENYKIEITGLKNKISNLENEINSLKSSRLYSLLLSIRRILYLFLKK